MPATQPARQFASRVGDVDDGTVLLEQSALECKGPRCGDDSEPVSEHCVETIAAR